MFLPSPFALVMQFAQLPCLAPLAGASVKSPLTSGAAWRYLSGQVVEPSRFPRLTLWRNMKNRKISYPLIERLTHLGLRREEQDMIVGHSLLDTPRLAALVCALRSTRNVAGHTAEIGACSGGTSLLMARLNGSRCHWACDTFDGLVDVGNNDSGLSNGMFRQSAAFTRNVLAFVSNVRIVEGYFPASAPQEMKDAHYSLVHIDVDTYASMRASLEFFYPRMSPRGLLVLDDVLGDTVGTMGAKKAFAERDPAWQVVVRAPPQAILAHA